VKIGPVRAVWRRVELVERLTNQQILDAGLVEWRKLAQALRARFFVVDGLSNQALSGELFLSAKTVETPHPLNLQQV
jgi:hypothetical protein